MLVTGHAASGYLVTKLAISSLIQYFPQANQPKFWAVGILSAVITDLDLFYLFFKIGKAIGSTAETNHRKFASHTPLIHLAFAVLIFGAAWYLDNSDWRLYGILYAIGSLTHFALDSLGYGIMWLWPFKKTLYAFKDPGIEFRPQTENFFEYWLTFLKIYFRNFLSWIEVGVIILALLVYFKIL